MSWNIDGKVSKEQGGKYRKGKADKKLEPKLRKGTAYEKKQAGIHEDQTQK
jgi:hypothetical protein